MQFQDLTFPDWVRLAFDQPTQGVAIYGASEEFNELNVDSEPKRALEFVTALFEKPEALIDQYTPDQIGSGIWRLVSGSSYLDSLYDPNAPLPPKLAWIESVYHLYAKLFQPICADRLGHLERGAEPERCTHANTICYMFWDLIGAIQPMKRGNKRRPNLVAVETMELTLGLKSIPCQEGALHGLGHWHHIEPEAVESAIDGFLAVRAPMNREIRDYARDARTGCIN